MNVEACKGYLKQFLDQTARHPASQVVIFDNVELLHVVQKILDVVIPGWRKSVAVNDWASRYSQTQMQARRALVELNHGDKLRKMLGDTAPQLSASLMHPWIWDSARSLWQSKHYMEAVGAAAKKVNAETQNKVGRRDISEKDLFAQSFSDDPPKPGAPRLRMPDDDGGRTALSLRRGIRTFAEGCYAALRNPVSHDLGELPEYLALEQLAMFSILARWVDAANVTK